MEGGVRDLGRVSQQLLAEIVATDQNDLTKSNGYEFLLLFISDGSGQLEYFSMIPEL